MHTINKLIVDLFLPDRIREHNGIDEANKLYADCIKDTLEQVLCSYPENRSIIFPSLTIDLGNIHRHDIPYELEKKLREIIDEQILFSPYSTRNHSDSIVAQANSSCVDSARLQVNLCKHIVAQANSSCVDSIISNNDNTLNTKYLKYKIQQNTEREIAINPKQYALEALTEYMLDGYTDLRLFGENSSLEMIAAQALESLTETEIIRLCDIMEQSVPALLRFVEIAQKDIKIAIINRMLNVKNEGDKDIESVFRSKSDNTDEILLTGFLLAIIYLSNEEVRHFCAVIKSMKDVNYMKGETLPDYVAPLLSAVSRIMSNDIGYYTTDYIHKLLLDMMASAEYKVQKERGIKKEIKAQNKISDKQGVDETSPIDSVRDTIVENLQTTKNDYDVSIHSSKFATTKESRADLEEGKSIPEIALETGKRIAVSDSGLVLVHPFFRMIFSRLGLLTDEDDFISISERIRAAKLLKFIVTGEQKMDDASLVLEKVICNIPLKYHINKDFRPTPNEQEEVEALLKAVISYWDPFHGTSIRTLRETFMQRKGVIEFDGQNWTLHVEGKSIDLLMDTIPWEFQYIITKWSNPIIVNWQKEM